MKNKVVDLRQISKPVGKNTVAKFVAGLIVSTMLIVAAGALLIGWILSV